MRGVKCCEAALAISLPVNVLPVKQIMSKAVLVSLMLVLTAPSMHL